MGYHFILTTTFIPFYTNYNLHTIYTPVKPDVLEELLRRTNYCEIETIFITQGFRHSFDFHYEGPTKHKDRSENLPLSSGTKYDLWDKIMKEVKEHRFAGPYHKIPFKYYMQSPVGLVLKTGGQTRLIFHLSYDFKEENDSFNGCTPDEFCLVQYKDLDYAIRMCLKWCVKDCDGNETVFMGKGDICSAFRVILGLPQNWRWTVLKAQHPITGQIFYFVDKNLAFGASISCSLFQRFSDCIHHIVETLTGRPMSCTNYLDDYLYVGATEEICNHLVSTFIDVATEIGLTVAQEKTEWATHRLIFLGIYLMGDLLLMSIPEDKRLKALNLAKVMKDKRKATIHELQQFTGYLNFLCKAIYPGRAFTRRMYSKIPWFTKDGVKLKKHHHVTLDKEFKNDCAVWIEFLSDHIQLAVCRPFIDFSVSRTATQLNLYMDSSGNSMLGFGGFFDNQWFAGTWDPGFIVDCCPSIEFMELYAITIAIQIWVPKLMNSRVILFTDNTSA